MIDIFHPARSSSAPLGSAWISSGLKRALMPGMGLPRPSINSRGLYTRRCISTPGMCSVRSYLAFFQTIIALPGRPPNFARVALPYECCFLANGTSPPDMEKILTNLKFVVVIWLAEIVPVKKHLSKSGDFFLEGAYTEMPYAPSEKSWLYPGQGLR